MAIKVSTVSQKGGVGKSILARTLGREFAALGWQVKIADLDISQSTCYRWHTRRLRNGIEPDVPVEQFGSVDKALKIADQYDMLILDGAPHGTSATRAIAQRSDLIVIPTGVPLDDLEPTVLLAHELVNSGVSKARIVFVLCKVGDSQVQQETARNYLSEAGYDVLPGSIALQDEYVRASDEGKALTETRFQSLNARAEEVIQAMVDKISQLSGESGQESKKRSVA